MARKRCPRCNSPEPHLHPAMQFEGEVQTCLHEYHLTPTPQNTPDKISKINMERREAALAVAFGPGSDGIQNEPWT